MKKTDRGKIIIIVPFIIQKLKPRPQATPTFSARNIENMGVAWGRGYKFEKLLNKKKTLRTDISLYRLLSSR